ncbi:MAG: hypothetical protein E6G97_14710 [Alphaproteobacteria bacterium]|nr:MAG: hypothetical protein E6G97_14710 [Alphaproteobacteria bacterium]
MRRLLPATFVSLLAACAAQAGPARYPQTYNDLFTFGMTQDEVARLVGAPLIYLSGARGSERYLVQRPASVPGFYPVDTRIVLQFRRGHLTGWRRDWQMRPFWF